MSKIISLADMLFCRQCIACGETLPLFSHEDFCSDCIKNVTRLKKDELVLAHVMKARSVFVYDGALRKALVRFKYNNNAQTGRYVANEIASLMKKDKEIMAADYIINVPNGKYTTDRLYNQSMFLAKIVARKCKLKFLPNALKKKQGIKSQLKCKTRLERKENIKAAFYAEKGLDLKGKTVVIIDDILTTGSTLNECAKVLEKAGAEKIYAVTAARALSSLKPIKIKLLDADIVFTKKPTVHYKFKR
ncbi:MAG: ComF family protein [Clostridia bacterium]|nr:ComF family protein [Clostridia bacterium]